MNNFLISSSHTIEFNFIYIEHWTKWNKKNNTTPVVSWELREKWGYFIHCRCLEKYAKNSLQLNMSMPVSFTFSRISMHKLCRCWSLNKLNEPLVFLALKQRITLLLFTYKNINFFLLLFFILPSSSSQSSSVK
jgi:hypothetical protein